MNNLGYIEQGSDLDTMFLDDEELQGFFSDLGRIKDPRQLRSHLRRVRMIERARGIEISYQSLETKNLTGKALLERRLHLLPRELRSALHSGKKTIADYIVYSEKAAEDKSSFKLIASADQKNLGQTNLSNGKLPADTFFLLMSIAIQEAAFDSSNNTFGKFDFISDVTRRGEWSLKVGSSPVFDGQPLEIFYRPDGKGIIGEWRLENPKLIAPQTDIEFSIDLPENSKNKFRVILRGVATV